MNIRKLHHFYVRLSAVRPKYFLLLAGIFAVLTVYGLRDNNITMIKLREAVYAADQQNGDVEKALQDLRAHVHGHMNTNLASGNNSIRPPIHLKARYERLLRAEQERSKVQNAQVQAAGEQLCAGRHPGDGFNAPRVACIQEYVSANAAKQRPIPDQLYKFDFISPRWSPDLAGISIILTLVFLLLFITGTLLERWVKNKLH